ncbi:hypothetical protein D621_21665 [beta proteobacterium AAP51]|nr:hypothetical protein D621_21665 [beta proteobacterium AAP51]
MTAESYAAFISYRHHEVDRKWATWLHGALERYRIPARVVQARSRAPRLGRVFRDEEELAASSDLSAEITTALERSQFLIVVCSPRTPGSEWVSAEIERFRAMGRGRQVLALLIEGEPSEAFPAALKTLHALSSEDAGVEPLAADVRASAGTSLRERRQLALMRLLAPMLGVSFDDLRQREQERQLRRLLVAGALGLALLTLVSGLAVVAYLQRNEAALQRDAAVRNLARSYAEAGATASAERDYMAAEVAYAKALLANDEPALREQLLDARARGFSLRWQVPGTGDIARAAISYDAKRIALAKANAVDIRDLETGRLLATLRTAGRPNAVAFNADGMHVAVGDDRGRMVVWEVGSSSVIHRRDAHDTALLAISFDAGTGEWRSVASDNRVKGWNPSRPGTEWSRAIEGPALSSALFVPGGIELAIGNIAGQVRIEPLKGGTARLQLEAHRQAVGALALSGDGAKLATWAQLPRPGTTPDAAVKIWTVADPRAAPVALSSSPGAPRADALAFDADARRLLTGQIANGLTVWDVRDGRRLARLGGRDGVSFVASGAGNAIVTAGPGLQRWDLELQTTQSLSEGHGHSAQAVAVMPDGRHVLSAGFDRMLRLWDAASGQARAAWPTDDSVHDIQVSPDGLWAATCSSRIELRDTTTGTLRWSHQAGFYPFRACLAFDPVAPRLYVAGAAGAGVIVRSTADGAEIERLSVSGGRVVALAAAAAADKLAVATSDGGITVFDLSTRAPLTTLRPTSGGISTLAFSADGSKVAATHRDTLYVWELSAPDTPRSGRVPATSDRVIDVHALAFSRDGLRLLTSAWGELAMWDSVTMRRLAVLRPDESRNGHLNGFALAPDGRSVHIGHDDGTLSSWRLEDSPEVRTLRGERGVLGAWGARGDGRQIAVADHGPSGQGKSQVLLFDLEGAGAAHASAAIPDIQAAALAYDPGGRWLYAAMGSGGDKGGLVRRWDLSESRWRAEFASLSTAPRALAVDATGQRVAVGGSDAPDAEVHVQVFDGGPLTERQRLKGHQRGLEVLRFDTAGSLWSGGLDYQANEWLGDGTRRPLVLHGGTVTGIAVSPDRRWRATASRDGSVRLFDSEGRLTRHWYSHRSGYGYAEDVDFSPDGRWLVSTGGDGRVLLRETGGEWPVRFVLRGHDNTWILSARFVNNGRWLVTRGHEGWLKVWDFAEVQRLWRATPGELAEETARRTGRAVVLER